ncbi:MAG: aminotransferase class IV [Deltaproteobacteria bacterium]|nr:aminotransferase class IV [Deltaproteobacteria bacterium]
MCRLFETIKILDCAIYDAGFHNKRFNHSRSVLFGCLDYIDLRDSIKIPPEHRCGIVKCRVVYSRDIETIEYERYNKRNISTLKIVNCDNIDYSYKYCDRSGIDRLFDLRGGHDDIIIMKNNRITDSSFCNLVFDDGEKLVTPGKPLLKGTRRDKLLSENKIVQDEIRLNDLKSFKTVHLINAMLDLDECKVGIDSIYR